MTDLADKMRAELPTLAQTIAAELGEGWTTTHTSEGGHVFNVRLMGPDGACLHLNVDWNSKGIVKIGGSYLGGTHRLWGLNHYDIGVSASRGAAKIAAEIKRRLLPDYLVELERFKGMVAAEEASLTEQRRVADLIAATLPQLRRSKDGNSFTLYSNDHVSLNVDVREGGSISIDRCYGDVIALLPALVAMVTAAQS